MKKSNPFAWENGFPPVYCHTSSSFLMHCQGFCEAKRGDMYAALVVASKCLNYNTVTEINKKYPDALLLPVITKNKLPEALARMLGLKMHLDVKQRETLSRKSLSAMERLLHKPVFDGTIVKGKNYIIVDDIITQGGTVSALRKHIISNGGNVCAIVAFSCSAGSNILAPNSEDICCLANRFSLETITNTLKYYNIANDLQELTRAQIRYILLFKGFERLINKIEKSRLRLAAF